MADLDYKSLFIDEPFEVYLKQSEKYLTSHQLMDFIKCPRIYYMRKVGAMPPIKSGAEMLLGRAAHTLILEGREVFDRSYAVGGPINEKTGNEYGRETKSYEKWLGQQKAEKGSSIEFITSTQWYVISQMARSVQLHAKASELLASGIAERVIRTNLHGIEAQCRMDWFRFHGTTPIIVDLKTCLDIDTFADDAGKFSYNVQFAFYFTMLLKAFEDAEVDKTEYDVPEVYVITVEKKETFRCGVFAVSPDDLGEQAGKNRVAVVSLLNCRRHSAWPTGYENIRTLSF